MLKRVALAFTDQEESLELRNCLSCAHWYINPMPSQTTLSALYQKSSPLVVPTEYKGTVKTFDYCANILHKVEFLLKLVKKINFRYLEIGTGSGVLFEAMELYSDRARTFGIEPGFDHEHKNNILSDIELLPDNALFDLVVSFDVLEHISDPLAILKEVSNLLSTGGIFVFTVPTNESFRAKLEKYNIKKWRMMIPLSHLHFFSKASIRELAQQSGLSISQIRKTRAGDRGVKEIVESYLDNDRDKGLLYFLKTYLLGDLLLGYDQMLVVLTKE